MRFPCAHRMHIVQCSREAPTLFDATPDPFEASHGLAGGIIKAAQRHVMLWHRCIEATSYNRPAGVLLRHASWREYAACAPASRSMCIVGTYITCEDCCAEG